MKTMKPKIIVAQVTTWARALTAALATVGKKREPKEPGDRWKAKMLLAEHSPIRLVEYDILIERVRTWVLGHLVRHWIGWIPFVGTQRADRNAGVTDRDALPQGSLNDARFAANAQSLITISRKRLCRKASPETREAWEGVKEAVRGVDPVMASKMVPECVYRGFCPELECCGYCNRAKFIEELREYRREALENGQKDWL